MFMPSRPGRPMSATPLRNIMEALFGVTARIREVWATALRFNTLITATRAFVFATNIV